MRLLITGGSGFIGTHLVDLLLLKGYEFVNISSVAPKKTGHLKFWIECNLMDINKLRRIFHEFKPEGVIHLAAKTDIGYKSLNDYSVNVLMTKNIIEMVKTIPSVRKLIIASTQLVHRPGHFPESDDDYEPVNPYAISKVECEKLVRKSELECCWIIIRPTYIWGPWYPEFRYPIWKLIKRGLYFFPGKRAGTRCYGYVGNTVRQIEKFLTAPDEKVNGKVFYIGDQHMKSIDWVNAFSIAIRGENVKIMPETIARASAKIGDVLSNFGIPFILNSYRLNNLLEDYYVPLEPTFNLIGKPEITLEQGVIETIEWLKWKKLI